MGCIKASFTIPETINGKRERGGKILSRLLDLRKAFVGFVDYLQLVYGNLYQTQVVAKDLYTDIKTPSEALHSSSLFNCLTYDTG